LGAVPAFSLLDHHQHPISGNDLVGSVWIADFIFTRCAGQCPIMGTQMAKLRDAFQETPGIRLVSFTVDPAYDTPDILSTYARRYHAQDGRWQFVTGDPQAVMELAREGFRLGASDGGTATEPITHSVRLVLVDQQGAIRGYYDATDAEAVARLEYDARQLVREEQLAKSGGLR
jgi:protein SCO1/2